MDITFLCSSIIQCMFWLALANDAWFATVLVVAGLQVTRREKKPPQRLMELSVCLEELMDTPTFRRFNNALDGVLEAAEDMDLASIRGLSVHCVCSVFHDGVTFSTYNWVGGLSFLVSFVIVVKWHKVKKFNPKKFFMVNPISELRGVFCCMESLSATWMQRKRTHPAFKPSQ